MLHAFVYNAAVLSAVMFALWLLSLAIRNASIVDIVWGPAFAIVSWRTLLGNVRTPLHWLLVAMVSVWAIRLGAYLAWRNIGKGEDYRYRAMREKPGRNFGLWSLVFVFGLQCALVLIVSLPVQAALIQPSDIGFVWLAVPGVASWLVGLFFEAVGDSQLARFRADPSNAGRVMDKGLWRYTRHPNYFGDFMIWWGIYLVALSAGAPAWTAIGPLVMSTLLMRVSGVALLERNLKQRRAGYEDYIRRTSTFFPRPPRAT